MDNYLRSIKTLSAKYKVSCKNIENCIVLGRLSLIDSKISVQEFSNIYHHDEKMIVLEELIEEVCHLENWILSKQNIREIKDEIEKTKNGGFPYSFYENLLIPTKSIKKSFYFEDKKRELSLIKEWIMQNLCNIPSENYKNIWGMLGERNCKSLVKGCGATPYEYNVKLQPGLHMIMSEIIMSGKALELWGIPEYQLFCKRHPQIEVQRLLKKILLSTESKEIRDFFKLAKIINFNSSKKHDERYSLSQYLSLGSLLLFPNYYRGEGIINRALEDSDISQALLYMVMNMACAWRREDILKIKLQEEVEIMELIEELKEGKVSLFKTLAIWRNFRYYYENFEVASKNKEPLHFALTGEPEKHMGIYLAICEYHRIKENRESLFSLNVSFDNLKNYKKALGDRCYKEIFGNQIFRNKLMNKALMDGYNRITSVRFQNKNYRSFPAILSAYLRSHKLDLENGQNTVFHYIETSSEGLSMDEISMSLFSLGTFGFYKEKVLSWILPKIKKYNLQKRAQIISAADLSISETEKELGTMSRIMDEIAGIEDLPNSLEILTNRIMDAIVNDTANGKEENVFCLYRAIHNRIPKGCSKQKYCTNCHSEQAYGKLCKFAIYSYEYIFNLALRLETYEKRIDEYIYLKEKTKREGNWRMAEVYEELCKLEERRRDKTRETVEQFIADESFPDELRNDVIKLYLEGE